MCTSIQFNTSNARREFPHAARNPAPAHCTPGDKRCSQFVHSGKATEQSIPWSRCNSASSQYNQPFRALNLHDATNLQMSARSKRNSTTAVTRGIAGHAEGQSSAPKRAFVGTIDPVIPPQGIRKRVGVGAAETQVQVPTPAFGVLQATGHSANRQ